MLIRFICAATYRFVRFKGWTFSGERPVEPKVMILGAPHTANFDYFLTLALIHHFDLPLRYLIKHTVFVGPLGWLLRSLGGIPVDRRKPGRLVERIIETIKEQDEIAVGVLPEGTRKRTDYWKSGFYHIASGAEIPIYPARVDGPGKHLHLGPALWPSGDIEADVAVLADFFEGALGVIPENRTPVRVRPRERKA